MSLDIKEGTLKNEPFDNLQMSALCHSALFQRIVKVIDTLTLFQRIAKGIYRPDGRIFKSLWIQKSHREIPLFYPVSINKFSSLIHTLNSQGQDYLESVHFFQNQ